jgi:predicted DNA-binding transcriptional regulator
MRLRELCFNELSSRRFKATRHLLAAFALMIVLSAQGAPEFLLDMTHANPGEGYPKSKFVDPQFLASWGYNGQVIGSIGGIQTFDELAPGLIAEGSAEREWAIKRTESLRQRVRAAHAAGIRCFAGTDMFLFPKQLITRFKADICDDKGRIDIDRPRTKEIFRALLRETFQRVPELDGIVVRTGEVYLQDYPYHAASGNFSDGKRQGGSAILRGEHSHIELLKILREEVCERLNKIIIYRTWSFGPQNFHENAKYYLKVTDAIAPHSNLVFSIKHQQGDFHQLTVWNPTLMIGQHRQIVEVQCQREAYGKGAHPYYIGDGVINGWEEYAWLMKPGQPQGLRDVITNRLCAGVWTWSRGGGWEGPFLKNELWCELNAYVVAEFAKKPARTEAEVFSEYARARLKLSDADTKRFRELNLLSAKAVLRGQLTTLGAKVNVWWARDHFFEAPDLSDFVKKGLVDKALAEKAEAVAMWREIEVLAREINFPDRETQEFVEVSATYGRIKYEIVQQAWTVLLYAQQGESVLKKHRKEVAAAIARYDALWAEWRQLEQAHASCASIYKDVGFDHHPGLGAAINRYRTLK